MKKIERTSCDCIPEAMPYLIFDNRTEKPFVKKRVKALWKSLSDIKDVILNPATDDKIKEKTPSPEPEAEENQANRQLFEKMLALRMDQHALAIADGYRTRPQVCVCSNVCCDCFDHSNFLHNLKLHDRKELLRKVYVELTNKVKPPTPNSEITEETRDENTSSPSDPCNEFTLKNEEDYESDDPNGALDLGVINRIKKIVCSEKTTSELVKKTSTTARKITRGVRVIKIDEPPYETKFNTVHRRVREFDPNLYKTLVREEIKRYDERRSKENWEDLSQRPPWKI
ncbi:hypothetical protein GE061_011270 [Apolygus lucorum]|uniref:Uncharacterized protein n=1 Tax=Apolygus lucorum TaxID=248454 RepID=A0A8S9XWX9_APOLU|nr:hypothetical protein GE061_011270 [Apolygus lucorum]